MSHRTARTAIRLVSKFYLRYFADDEDMITTVFLPGDRFVVQNIANASVQNNFYTGIGLDGQETDVAEDAFGLIEAPAAEAWEQIACGVWPLRDDGREAVAAWVALHLLRGGGNRNQMSEIGTDLLNLQVLSGGRARLREVLREQGLPCDESLSIANGSTLLRRRSGSMPTRTITSTTSLKCCRRSSDCCLIAGGF